MRKLIIVSIKIFIEVILLPIFTGLCFLYRFKKSKPFDIGIGPEPLITAYYHKLALQKHDYRVESFVSAVYHIFDKFDFRLDQKIPIFFNNAFFPYILFFRVLQKYRCIYIYFNGGPLGFSYLLWRIEPFFYKLANIKTVVTGYGSDVQDMSRSKNLVFKNAMSHDYPNHKHKRKLIERKIDLWTKYGNHIIGGCEWVDYMHSWDSLMIAHFCIDTEEWKPDLSFGDRNDNVLKVFHAPNHKKIKGSSHIMQAVRELQEEGIKIELVFKQRVPNSQIKSLMEEADVIVDQLIIGWYAMFAIEAMSLEKPVIVYLRQDLIDLYQEHGLLKEENLPFIRADFKNIKEKLRWCYENKKELKVIGKRSRSFVEDHHSLISIGKDLDKVNRKIGIIPSR